MFWKKLLPSSCSLFRSSASLWVQFALLYIRFQAAVQVFNLVSSFAVHIWLNKAGSGLQRNIEARSCKHFCCGKAVSVTYPENAFVAFGIHNAMSMRHIIICSQSDPTIYFHIISWTAQFFFWGGGPLNFFFFFFFSFVLIFFRF